MIEELIIRAKGRYISLMELESMWEEVRARQERREAGIQISEDYAEGRAERLGGARQLETRIRGANRQEG